LTSTEGQIADDAILVFNKGFYETLLDGYSVEQAFRMGKENVRTWEQDEGIKTVDKKPYFTRIHLISKSVIS
jgi:hypothetical protein